MHYIECLPKEKRRITCITYICVNKRRKGKWRVGRKLITVKAMHRPMGLLLTLNAWSHICNSLGLFYWIRSVLAEISSNNACYWAEIPWHMITLNASQGAFVLDLSNCKISLSEASLETSIYRF